MRSPDIRNGGVTGRDVKLGSLGGREVNEASLDPVPQATYATTLGGLGVTQLRLHCPDGTAAASAICVEIAARPPESFGQANTTCSLAGRRLLTYAELIGFYSFQRPVAAGGELTANVTQEAGQLNAVVVENITGSDVDFIGATGPTQRAFRCGAALSN